MIQVPAEPQIERPRNWLVWATRVSVAYAVLVSILFLVLGFGCSTSSTGHCLAANELGDVLAGIFAPLAFVWLAAAVLIQSQELAAQREELRLTREEVSQNRTVMIEQAEEARRQAEFIGRQTEILSEQRSEQIAAGFDLLYEKRADALRDWMARDLVPRFQDHNHTDFTQLFEVTNGRPLSFRLFLREARRLLGLRRLDPLLSVPPLDAWLTLQIRLNQIVPLEFKLSPVGKQMYRDDMIEGLMDLVQELVVEANDIREPDVFDQGRKGL